MMVTHESLQIDAPLAGRFERWIENYDYAYYVDKLDEYNEEGMLLARMLKAHLGPDIHVEYEPEPIDRSRPPVVIPYEGESPKFF